MKQTSPYPIQDNGLIRYGSVVRQHWNGRIETLREDISEPDAIDFLRSDKCIDDYVFGDTFDHFVPDRWACP